MKVAQQYMKSFLYFRKICILFVADLWVKCERITSGNIHRYKVHRR